MATDSKKSASPLEAKNTDTPQEPRNFFAAFLLTSLGGYVGLRHFYLGAPKIGWLRAGLFIGGYLVMFGMLLLGQPIIAFVGILAAFAAVIWAIIDFFYVYFVVKTDASGQPLIASAHDKKWAKIVFWLTVGGSILAVVGYIILMVVAYTNPTLFDTPTDSSSRFRYSDEQPYLDNSDTVY